MTREEAIEYGREWYKAIESRGDSAQSDALTFLAWANLALQSVKAGKWIEKDGWDGDVYYDCSACGESWITIEGTPWDNDMNYCPHCGAKMEGAE